MFKRLALIAAMAMVAAIAIDPSAGAQTAGSWTSQDGRITILGAVNMCVDPAGKATPCQGTPVTAASGNVANASAVATLAGSAGLTTYICGLQITGSGATAASVVSATLTGLISGTATYTVAVPAGVTAGVQPLVISLAPCIPASSTNTSIVLTLPALGAGNTNAAVAAQGFRY